MFVGPTTGGLQLVGRPARGRGAPGERAAGGPSGACSPATLKSGSGEHCMPPGTHETVQLGHARALLVKGRGRRGPFHWGHLETNWRVQAWRDAREEGCQRGS